MAASPRIQRGTLSADGLRLELDVGQVDVAWSAERVLRLRMGFPDDARASPAPALEPSFEAMDQTALAAWRAPLVSWQATAGIDSSAGTTPNPLYLPLGGAHGLRIDDAPLQFTLLSGPHVLWQSLGGRTMRVDALGRRWTYHVREESHLFYGLGEKSGRLVRNDRSFQMKGVDAAGYDPATGDPLYKHIPFYLVHQPTVRTTIGVFVNNAWPSRFDFGAERSAYWPGYASICTDGGDLDLFLLTGPTPADVLGQYHALTGFPALPTKASLGYLGSSMFYTELDEGCDEAVLGFVDRCAAEGVELSGFHLSSGYTKDDGGLRNTLTWNRRGFPDPQGFIERFQADGLVLSPNVKPAMLTSHPLWSVFDAAGAFVRSVDGGSATEQFWGGQASLVDFSNPVARDLWRQHLVEALVGRGITSIWNDNNEFELDDDRALCDNDGSPVAADSMRPLLANVMAQVAWEAVRDTSDARPFILSRAGFAGLQKYAQTWSGDNTSDWANFNLNLATMLGLSLSGMPFNGMDIGGFTGPAPEPELFARWVQSGALHPRFCIHSVNSDNTVTEPWLYPELTTTIAAAIRQRNALLPTLYSAAAQAHEEGLPVARPLVFEFPEFAPGFDRHTEFLVGSALLAVAVTEPGVDSVDACFPPGEWTDVHTGARQVGGRLVQIPVCPERSPLYARTGHGYFLDGRFVDPGPSGPGGPAQRSDVEEVGPASGEPILIARLGMRADGSAQFYDDDGRTRANESGHCLRSRYSWARTERGLHLRHQAAGPFVPEWTRLRLELDIGPVAPLRVTWTFSGQHPRSLRRSLHHDFVDAHDWYYRAGRQLLHVELPPTAIAGSWELDLDLAQGMAVSTEPG